MKRDFSAMSMLCFVIAWACLSRFKGIASKMCIRDSPKTEHTVSDSKHMDFYRKQLPIALRNCGFIDPENIEEYIVRKGYFCLCLLYTSRCV